MITVFFLSGIAIVAVFLGMFIIRGRSRQAKGMSGLPAEEQAKAAPKPTRANGMRGHCVIAVAFLFPAIFLGLQLGEDA